MSRSPLRPTALGAGTHVGKEWEMEVLPQVPHGPTAPVFEDVQVRLPFVLRDEMGGDERGVLLVLPPASQGQRLGRLKHGSQTLGLSPARPQLFCSDAEEGLSPHPCPSPRVTTPNPRRWPQRQPPGDNPPPAAAAPLGPRRAWTRDVIWIWHQGPEPSLHPPPAAIPPAHSWHRETGTAWSHLEKTGSQVSPCTPTRGDAPRRGS